MDTAQLTIQTTVTICENNLNLRIRDFDTHPPLKNSNEHLHLALSSILFRLFTHFQPCKIILENFSVELY